MENYYTPEIEEFHVGFEFEWDDSRSYESYELESHMFDDVVKDLQKGTIRVKHLDREDIESEGWEYSNENGFGGLLFWKGDIELSFYQEKQRIAFFKGGTSSNMLAAVNTKNKSEFKRIEKQIGR